MDQLWLPHPIVAKANVSSLTSMTNVRIASNIGRGDPSCSTWRRNPQRYCNKAHMLVIVTFALTTPTKLSLQRRGYLGLASGGKNRATSRRTSACYTANAHGTQNMQVDGTETMPPIATPFFGLPNCPKQKDHCVILPHNKG